MSIALTDPRPVISLLGTTALLFEAPGSLDLAPQQRIWAMARVTAQWPEISESVPGMNNLMLTFKTPPRHLDALTERLLETWQACEPLPLQGRIIELPVTYGGEHGPHMGDVIAHTGLDIETIAHLHSEPLYPVYALGSHPGYCYLGGMDPRIATPRRKVPVLSIGAGAVSIGGVQTGVSASAGPSGWNTIGRTEMSFFDPGQSPPALLQPGDLLRFRIERIIR
ncbi:5-oxoprolinase subunit PxpB [Pseudomonas cichorii]|uniref:5-oxoprolinase subunit PxpB n=1 Tax=Pseudomonas lijiangensis TaxID=2995658 RepID=A0ABX8HLY3_9PSED|nr:MULTISPECIES: 5-oxoprolinase subunit PxpB [Pseudomonas syringae group]MBX8488350.1 5-oxoprolinase subunit PxpB [Pseudomonas cichorii]MBX8498369.1 5-oxoprolinase subunit PxpB [Pseudomonas lijiangensis]MBX8503276.1 5-oxoprolinase subunit PxpB [Pseudomonas lijiangensis]MBX8511726.1 5-oxoprolinase subunit PxpB [Pseudomonas cichorii]MBX8519023.1 5-oxoprolinase subunit PxpB [Pseudomonas cichorii]